MKKTILVLFVIVICITGCSLNNAQLSVNPIATTYLTQLNVQNSKINTINYDKISSFKNAPPSRDLTYISGNIDEVLEPFYSINVLQNRKISNRDFVVLELELLNKEDMLIFIDKTAKLLIGAGLFDEKIESNLVGCRINKSYVFDATDKVKKFYNIFDVDKIIIKPQSILQYKEGIDTKTLLDENGFSSLDEFYVYLFNMKVGEHDFEKNSSIKDNFIKYAVNNCTFTIPYDDLKNYSDTILREHMNTAESLGVTIDEYYTNVLSLNEEEFFKMCADSAEMEIKKCLMIGALSQYFGVNVTDELFSEFCQKNEINASDEISQTIAGYLCLESLVISRFVQLI